MHIAHCTHNYSGKSIAKSMVKSMHRKAKQVNTTMSEKRVNKDCGSRKVHVKTCIPHLAYSSHTLHTDSN